MLMQVAGQEAGRSGGAENQEVIQGLGLAALIRAIAGGNEVGRANEQEIPAHTIQCQRNTEMPFAIAGKCGENPQQQQRNAPEHDIGGAITRNQIAGEEGWHEHPHHMHEDYPMRFGMRQPARHNRKR